MQKPLEGGLGHWGQGLSPKRLGFAATHGGVPSQAVEGQPSHTPTAPMSWRVGAQQDLGDMAFENVRCQWPRKSLAWPHAGVALGMGLQGDMWQRQQEDDLQAWASFLVPAASRCSGAPSPPASTS